MDCGYTQQIRERIQNAPDGRVFVSSDFADIADSNTIKQILSRLVRDGELRRIIRGVFDRPRYSKLLNEFVTPDVDEVAKALARSYHWTIAPSGIIALNMLGLSTQIPAKWSYISDGPYKTYELGKIEIEFKHRTNKEIAGLSPISILVIQALKTIKKENITDKTIRILSRRLSKEQKIALLAEGKEATDWIYEVIKKICKGEKEDA